MSRPFRFNAPSPPDRYVVRQRLLDLVSQRWERRLLTIVAGPGFGKTALLAASMTDDQKRQGVDVWLSCEPADEAAAHLLGGVAEALGLSSDAGITTICDSVWARAPEVVCLVFDDTHEITPRSGGARVMSELLTDLPGNARMVLASRSAVPVPTARLAATGQLTRITEDLLAFDDRELVEFADQRHVSPTLLASAAGWPALAELTATAGTDLVLDYLWEEVLDRVGAERVSWLARFAAVGGGDDEVASAIAGRPLGVADLVRAVPLVRKTQGWAALHPMWHPVMRRIITEEEANEARVEIASIHRRHERFVDAIELLAAACDWDGLAATVREVELCPWVSIGPSQRARWRQLVPLAHQREPAMLLSAAIELEARDPGRATSAYRTAAAAFADVGDMDGELVAIAHEGLVRWWAGDVVGLFGLYRRVAELAERGSTSAVALNAICLAAIAHLGGDSPGVHRHLEGFDESALAMWRPQAQWLRSVAYRRDGDLANARQALDAASQPAGHHDPQLTLAHLRIDWLEGLVDDVRQQLAPIADAYRSSGERVLARDAILELACKTAWLGEVDAARALLAQADEIVLAEVPSLHDVLRCIACAALAVADGNELSAAALLEPQAASALDGPTAWYWRDRAAIALVHELMPWTRPEWPRRAMAPPHAQGLVLAQVLSSARGGDLGPAASLRWPAPGVVRAHLPARWCAELAVYGSASGNPPPPDLVEAIGLSARATLRELAGGPSAGTGAAARRLLAGLPSASRFTVRVNVLGPLTVERDGEVVNHGDLRRQRVRELLCYLATHESARREVVANEIWPDAVDPAHNLRVTLNYLQRVLQPERDDGETPYFVRSVGPGLTLARVGELSVDQWDLEALLVDAEDAERRGSPAEALGCYRRIIPMWRGEPLVDAQFSEWAPPLATTLRRRYVVAALRGGELLLASNDAAAALDAARQAIEADRYSEVAHQLAIRCHLALGDVAGARAMLEQCSTNLSELDVSPQVSTVALLQ